MSVLDRVREKYRTPMSDACKTVISPFDGFEGAMSNRLKKLGRPSEGSAGLSRRQYNSQAVSARAAPSHLQEAARRDVLGQLEANPQVQRAFVNRFESGLLIVTLAIRNVGTCELVIPTERFDAGNLADYAALLDCMREGPGNA
jgi:hypothetical protein